jgi:23S rRNA pseudouridine1911/1915/1917 synthase
VGEAGTLFLSVSSTSPVSHSEPADSSLLAWLAARYPTAKRQTLRRMLQSGRVSVNGQEVRNARLVLTPDDRIEISDPAAPPPPDRPKLRIVYEDDDILVVDKPAGLLTSTVPREPRATLLAAVGRHLEIAGSPRGSRVRVGLIHRLDRDASGLLVFSKNHEAYQSLKQQFFAHSVQRVYTAVVEGVPNPRSGRIETRLVERADGTVYSTRRPREGERAVTDYEVADVRGSRALVRVTLHTGRKHQIRVHLGERGTPIVGDKMYGRKPGHGRLMLAATKLSFAHPRTGERLTFERPAPRDFAAAFASAGREAEPITGKSKHQ